MPVWSDSQHVLDICFRQCAGNGLRHDDHDPIFGGKRVYIVCVAIWVVALLARLPDILEAGSSYFVEKLFQIFRKQESLAGLVMLLFVMLPIPIISAIMLGPSSITSSTSPWLSSSTLQSSST